MYKIVAKFKPSDSGLEFTTFEELVSLENYNDIKMLSIEGDPDNYYVKVESEQKKARRTRVIYNRKWVQYRDGKPGRYELVPEEIEMDSDDEELQNMPPIIEKRDYLPDYFTFPISLVKFVLYTTNIVGLPKMEHLTKLKKVMCLFNRLESFPDLPQSVEILDISGNPLAKLPKLQDGIQELRCDGCRLTTINIKLPQSLKIFKCSNNQLKHIDYLPENLEWFNCSSNELLGLPHIPYSLIYLNCSYNQIKGLPGSIIFTKLCNYILYSNGTYQFYHAKVNYNEEKLIINDNPVCDLIKTECGGKLGDYIFYKKAVDIIERAYLEAKYNPKYKYCRDRLENEYDNMYEK